MRVFSYLELHTTLIAWQLYGVLYDVITQTGLILVPLAWSLVRITAQAVGEDRSEGHEAPVGNLKAVLQMTVVILFCLVPIYTISPSAISFDPPSGSGAPGGEVTTDSDPTTYGEIIPSGGATQVPAWWALLHNISTGVAYAVIQSLPTYTDLREAKVQMTALNVHDSTLAGEYRNFLNTCYYPAKQNYHRLRQKGAIERAAEDENPLASLNWAGSHYLLEMPGGYLPCSGGEDCQGAPHFLDPRLASVVGAEHCADWWEGMRTRIFEQARADDINYSPDGHIDDAYAALTIGGTHTGGSFFMSQREREDTMIRKTLENHEMRLAASPDSTERDSSLLGNIVQGARNVATLAGGAAVWFSLEIMLGIVQQALPIMIAILLMFLVMMIPLALLFTGFRIEPVIRISFLVFSAIFLHALLAIADWLDYYLTVSLFEGQAHAWLAADDRTFGHAQKRMLVNIVLLMNYIAVPMLWFSLMGAVGASAAKGGSGLLSASGSGSGPGSVGHLVSSGAGKSLTTPGGMARGVTKTGSTAVRKFKF